MEENVPKSIKLPETKTKPRQSRSRREVFPLLPNEVHTNQSRLESRVAEFYATFPTKEKQREYDAVNFTTFTLQGKYGGTLIISNWVLDFVKPIVGRSWTLSHQGYVIGNVRFHDGTCKSVPLSTYLLGFMKTNTHPHIDHINNVKNDYRLSNLRVCSLSENNHNKTKLGSVRYLRNAFEASIMLNLKWHYLGRYKLEQDAKEAIDMFVIWDPEGGYDSLNENLHYPEKEQEYRNRKYIRFVQKTRQPGRYGVTKGPKRTFRWHVDWKKTKWGLESFATQDEAARSRDQFIVQNNIPGKKLNYPSEHPQYQEFEKNRKKLNAVVHSDPEDQNGAWFQLPTGQKVLIDKEDEERVIIHRCHIVKGYVQIVLPAGICALHRYILSVTDPDIVVDHRNGVPLDNIKSNLRAVSREINGQNRRPNAETGIQGVRRKTSETRGIYYETGIKFRGFNYCKTNINIDIVSR